MLQEIHSCTTVEWASQLKIGIKTSIRVTVLKCFKVPGGTTSAIHPTWTVCTGWLVAVKTSSGAPGRVTPWKWRRWSLNLLKEGILHERSQHLKGNLLHQKIVTICSKWENWMLHWEQWHCYIYHHISLDIVMHLKKWCFYKMKRILLGI